MEDLQQEVVQLREQLTRETRRANNAIEELRVAREQNLAVHKQVEQEEEYITNKLMKRLEQLKKEKQLLANEVEQEEEFLTNTLHKKLEKLMKEKEQMENQLEAEQEYVVNKLQKKLEDLNHEKASMNQEKVRLEMQLEQEQEYIVNKLQKQVESLASEKSQMKQERSKLQSQIDDLTSSVMKLSTEKVKLEQELESEEEQIVNRMQRQFDTLMENYSRLERIMKAHNLHVAESELLPMPFSPALESRQFQFVRWSPPLVHSVGYPRPNDALQGWKSRSLSASPHRVYLLHSAGFAGRVVASFGALRKKCASSSGISIWHALLLPTHSFVSCSVCDLPICIGSKQQAPTQLQQ